MRRRTLALAAALALAGTLVFPSAAAPLLGGPSDDLGGSLELVAGADSEYATVGPDGELALDFTPGDTGLNPRSTTTFGEAFYVRYTGDRYAEVWLSADSAAVDFAVAGEPAGSRAERVTLGPGAVVPVTVRVDTRIRGPLDVDGVTVHSRVAEPPSDGERASTVEAATTGASVPTVQRRVTGPDSATFTMLAPTAGEPLTLDTGGTVVAGDGDRAAVLESVAMTPASSDAMTVAVSRTAAGPLPDGTADALGAVRVDASADVDAATFRLAVDDAFLEDTAVADAGDLAFYRESGGEYSEVALSVVAERADGVVLEGTTPGFSTFVLAAERPALGVGEASVSPAAVSANESATVTATVTNDGGAAGERTVAVTVGGDVVAERGVSLAAGESATVTASIAPGPGEHAVAVGGVDAGTLVVAGNDSGGSADGGADADDADDADTGDEPLAEPAGFDAETLLAAGLAVALVVVGTGVWRRRRGGAE